MHSVLPYTASKLVTMASHTAHNHEPDNDLVQVAPSKAIETLSIPNHSDLGPESPMFVKTPLESCVERYLGQTDVPGAADVVGVIQLALDESSLFEVLPAFIEPKTTCPVLSTQTVVLPMESGKMPSAEQARDTANHATIVARKWPLDSTLKFWTLSTDIRTYIVKGFKHSNGKSLPQICFYVWDGKKFRDTAQAFIHDEVRDMGDFPKLGKGDLGYHPRFKRHEGRRSNVLLSVADPQGTNEVAKTVNAQNQMNGNGE